MQKKVVTATVAVGVSAGLAWVLMSWKEAPPLAVLPASTSPGSAEAQLSSRARAHSPLGGPQGSLEGPVGQDKAPEQEEPKSALSAERSQALALAPTREEAWPPLEGTVRPRSGPWHPALVNLLPRPVASASKDPGLEASLRYLNFDVAFAGSLNLEAALSSLAHESGVALRILPGAARQTSALRPRLSLQGIPFGKLLRLLLAAGEGLGFEVAAGELRVGTLAELTPAPPAAHERVETPQDRSADPFTLLPATPVTVEFRERPLEEVLRHLQRSAGGWVEFHMTRISHGETLVSLRADAQPLREVVAKLLESLGLGLAFRAQVFWVISGEDSAQAQAEQRQLEARIAKSKDLRSVSVDLPPGPATAAELADLFGAIPGLEVVIDADARSCPLRASIRPRATLEEACQELDLQTGVAWGLERSLANAGYRLTLSGGHVLEEALLASAGAVEPGAGEEVLKGEVDLLRQLRAELASARKVPRPGSVASPSSARS